MTSGIATAWLDQHSILWEPRIIYDIMQKVVKITPIVSTSFPSSAIFSIGRSWIWFAAHEVDRYRIKSRSY